MKALTGMVVVALAGAGLAAVVIGPAVVSAQGRRAVPLERSEPRRVQFDGFGGSIGVNVRDVSADEGQRAKLSPAEGAYVTRVENGSPAQKAGIQSGDIIVEFDGERVRSARQLSRLVRESPDDRTVKSTIVRDGSRRPVELMPSNDRAGFAMPDLDRLDRQLRDLAQRFEFRYDGPGGRGFGGRYSGARGRLGVSLSGLSDQLATYFGVKSGVLVTSVDMDSPAGHAGLKAGDVITAINSRTVNDPSDVLDEVRRADDGGTLALTVTRDKKELKLTAKIPERERPVVRTGRSI
jgi:serine protease Do